MTAGDAQHLVSGAIGLRTLTGPRGKAPGPPEALSDKRPPLRLVHVGVS